MIVVDTNIWVDHLRSPVHALRRLLDADEARMHPYVLGELALGNLHDRARTLAVLSNVPPPPVADHSAVLALIEEARLFGTGIGYVDAHLLVSTSLARGARLWTRDKRLGRVAERLSLSAALD